MEIPSARLNARCRWDELMLNFRLNACISSRSVEFSSMCRQTSRINSERRPVSDEGWHRRHGRNPASSAWVDALKKRTCDRLGRRDGQVGRQYTPVDRTA
jgi:hypothetical protein